MLSYDKLQIYQKYAKFLYSKQIQSWNSAVSQKEKQVAAAENST